MSQGCAGGRQHLGNLAIITGGDLRAVLGAGGILPYFKLGEAVLCGAVFYDPVVFFRGGVGIGKCRGSVGTVRHVEIEGSAAF